MAKQKSTGAGTGENENNNPEGEVKKERKARETKVKHAAGSPHDVLHKFVDTLNTTQADYLNRHVIRKALKDDHADPTTFEGELYTGIKEKLA